MFKIPGRSKNVPESPLRLLYELNKVEAPRLQQGESLKAYKKLEELSDISIEMPAGSGKTLVGGYIAGYEIEANSHRVVYACATNQLANQTKELLDSYGLNTVLLIGKTSTFEYSDKMKYLNNKSIAVTTYSHIFNMNPFFDDPDVLIFDDAHAAENSISELWTVKIKKYEQSEIYNTFYKIVRSSISQSVQNKIDTESYGQNYSKIDIISHHNWYNKIDEIRSYLDTVAGGTNIFYGWSKLRELLEFCQIFINDKEIIIKPSYYPNQLHSSFSGAKKRIYMSATIGEPGDLEKIFSVKEITKISEFEGGLEKVSGRRLLLFPEDTFDSSLIENIVLTAINKQSRVLVLTSTNRDVENVKKWVEEKATKYKVFTKVDIEESLAIFKNSDHSILILANRYEGIDLKDAECRLQIMLDFPTSVGETELFLQNTIKASTVLSNKVAMRFTQALGRCTRSRNDFAAVMILGDSLKKYLFKREFKNLLPSEIHAELNLSLEQFEFFQEIDQWEASFDAFMKHGDEWKDAEEYLQEKTKLLNLEKSEIIQIGDYQNEIDFQYNIIEKKYEQAHRNIDIILKNLSGREGLEGYRAWWNYNKSIVYTLQENNDKSSEFVEKALFASNNKNWLVPHKLSSFEAKKCEFKSEEEEQIDYVIEFAQNQYGNSAIFNKKIERIRAKLYEGNPTEYEQAFVDLGKMLGYNAYKPNDKLSGVPDGVWQFGEISITFEIKSGRKNRQKVIPLEDISQAYRHREWLEMNRKVELDSIIPVMVEFDTMENDKAHNHIASKVFLFTVEDSHKLFDCISSIYRETIAKFDTISIDEVKLYLMKEFKSNNLFAELFVQNLRIRTISQMNEVNTSS